MRYLHKSKMPHVVVLLFSLLLAGTSVSKAAPVGNIKYNVAVANAEEHRFHISISLNAGDSPHIIFAIPAWAPGYYQILQFQKDISNFQAVGKDGQELRVSHPDERTWDVFGAKGMITASYDVNATDAGFGFFGSHLDTHTGYINGASALMYVVGGKELPASIKYTVPAGWKLVSSLDPDGSSQFHASGYDELIDCPVQMGELERLDFDVKGTPYSAIFVGGDKVDRAGMEDVLKKVSAEALNLFGYAPFHRYIYFFHFSQGNFGGGLEHRNSTVLNVSPFLGQSPHAATDLVAHEYFHAWDVKRLHPAVLGPFDYTQKVRTSALWFCEGVTDYYSAVLPRMADMTTEQQFLNNMAGRINQLQHNAARLKVSAEEASQKAWEGFSMGYGGLSYYLKGSLLGLVFDVKIRAATDNAKSLDDVMRMLDVQYGKPGKGYEEDGLLKAINEVSGKDFTDAYYRYVRSTEEIPWNDILKDAGLKYEEGMEKIPYLGVQLRTNTGSTVIIDKVQEETSASSAGLQDGDRIITVNGARITPDTFSPALGKLRVGQHFLIGIRRGDKGMDVPITLGSREVRYIRLAPVPDADAREQKIRAGLLRSTAGNTTVVR